MGGNHCLSKCDKPSRVSIVDTLLRISQNTWDEIRSINRKSLGFELIPSEQFRTLKSTVTPDVTKLKVFRYSEYGRIAGYRERDIYHILGVGIDLYKH